MIDNIDHVTEYLTGQGYAVWTGGKLLFTNKYYREATAPLPDPMLELKVVPLPLKEQFHQYMKDAEIPFQAISPSGSKYTIKMYSAGASKSFQDALKTISYEDLVRCTAWYYRQKGMMFLTIQNYLEKEVWRSALEFLVSKNLTTGSVGGIRTISRNK